MNRTRISRLLTLTALAVLGVVLSSSIIWAQATPPAVIWPPTTPLADTFKVTYFSNANTAGVPDGTVYLTNPGTSGGSICAMIYVLDPNQELLQCCGCSLTPDSLSTISVNNNLTRSPLVPEVLTFGTIKIISSSGAPTCNPSKPVPTPAVRGWGTHIQIPTGFGPYVTETDFQDATLSSTEVSHLASLCKSILDNASGYGICTCGTGG
ncbi:MAG: hypothetical protein ABSH32_03135 [Bryobacteraceae bacterium]|jgi:hypothetical protein